MNEMEERLQYQFEDDLRKVVDKHAEEELHAFQRLMVGLNKVVEMQQLNVFDRVSVESFVESMRYLENVVILKIIHLIEEYATIFSVFHSETKPENIITPVLNYFSSRRDSHNL